MKTSKLRTISGMFALALIVTLALTACPADTNSGGGTVPKTYTITLKNGTLVFVVEYKALPSEEPPYLAYLKTRLSTIVNSDSELSVEAVTHLMSKGNSFTIKVEDTGSSYEGINWNTATQSFKVHKDWISAASESDLSAAMIRNAFNSVV
jgi:hypothetical protein